MESVRDSHQANFVLLVDDDEMQREILSSFVRDFGCELKAVASVEEALKYLPTVKNLRCIISDIQLETLTGIEFSQLVRDKYPDVLFIGISSNVDYQESSLCAGFDAFIQKPIKKSRLKRFLKWS